MTSSVSRLPESVAWNLDNRLEYKVRVRGVTTPVFLWGSAGILVVPSYSSSVLLHIRNDAFGETINLGLQSANSAQTSLGTLQAGEAFTVQIVDIVGVYATCATESSVYCVLKAH